MKMIYRPTVLTLLGFAVTIAAISGTTGYILGRAPSLPGVLPVHFDRYGIADQFVPTSYTIALVPVWIQLSLAVVFGAIAGVLLYRSQHVRSAVENETSRRERERMLMTSEAISLLCAIWVTFQGLLAIRLVIMWQRMCCGLGAIYYQSLVVAIVLSAIVAVRAAVYVQYPEAGDRRHEQRPLAAAGHLLQPERALSLRAPPKRRRLDTQFWKAASRSILWGCAVREHLGAGAHPQGAPRGIKAPPPVFY